MRQLAKRRHLCVVSARFARCASQCIVVVVFLLVEPGLDAGSHPGTHVTVDVQILTELLVADGSRTERRLTVLELTAVRPLLSQFRQLVVPTLCILYRYTRSECVYTYTSRPTSQIMYTDPSIYIILSKSTSPQINLNPQNRLCYSDRRSVCGTVHHELRLYVWVRAIVRLRLRVCIGGRPHNISALGTGRWSHQLS